MDFTTIYRILSFVVAYSVLVPIILCFVCYKHFNNVSKLVFIYLLLSLLAETMQVAFNFYAIKSNIAMDGFSFCEFSILFPVFYVQLKPRGYVKNILLILGVFAYSLFIYGCIISSQTLFHSFYTLYLFALALFFIFKEDRELNIPNLLDNYFYWYNTGFLVFFGTFFFLMVFDDFIIHAEKTIARLLWCIQHFNNLIFYTVLSIGIWKTRLT